MQYVDRTFGKFDATKPLVASRQMTLLGHEVTGGDSISELKDDAGNPLDSGVACRLWMTRWADYAADYTPTPEQETHGAGREWMDEADGVSVTEGDNGEFTIHADWLGADGEKVQGAEEAEVRTAEVRETGDTKGVTYAHTGGGWYDVSAPWLAEPVKVKGADAAKTKATELIASQTPLKPVSETEAMVLVTVNDDETFTVSAPWLAEPETFANAEAAEARQAALREAGPPEGWTPSADDTTGE